MQAKIYEYTEISPCGEYITFYKTHLVHGLGGGCCWEIETEIPDYLNPSKGDIESIIFISPEGNDGFTFELSEILRCKNDKPFITWYEYNGKPHYLYLPVLSRTEESTAEYL